ncbi:MAG: NAD(P)-dependent oxidoreductase [Leifsonia flava]
MTTIVTGGSGRLGRSVISGLADAGHDVVSLDRAAASGLDVDQIAVDLTDPAATAAVFERLRPDAVVHLAAIAVPFSAPERTILSTNTALAFGVMEAAIAAGVERIAVASSPTVLGYGAPNGWLPPAFPLDERTPLRPWHAYGVSKLVAEESMRMLARTTGDSVRFAAFRPCFVIAPEEWEGAPTQQGHTVRERLDDPALSAPALFNYVDARDASRFVALLLERLGDIPNAETFFVGADDALARLPLADLLPRFVPGSDELAAGLTGTSPAFSSAKARELLGWQPQYSWRSELADTTTPTDTLSRSHP